MASTEPPCRRTLEDFHIAWGIFLTDLSYRRTAGSTYASSRGANAEWESYYSEHSVPVGQWLSEHLLAAPRRRVPYLDVSLEDVLEPRSAQRKSRRGSGGTPQIVPSRRPSLQGCGSGPDCYTVPAARLVGSTLWKGSCAD